MTPKIPNVHMRVSGSTTAFPSRKIVDAMNSNGSIGYPGVLNDGEYPACFRRGNTAATPSA